MRLPFPRQAIDSARKIDLVDYLYGLGFRPQRRRGAEYAYFSPFRRETRPSFMVNRRTNLWKDFGSGNGGTIIDFCMQYFDLNFREAMEKLQGPQSRDRVPPRIPKAGGGIPSQNAHPLKILKVGPLREGGLIRYLKSRGIDPALGDKYCRQLEYSVGSHRFKGIGFPNDKGGFEIRTPWWKGGNSPKWVSCFEHGEYVLHVFEGFLDFLSFLSDPRWRDQRCGNYLVLNSLSFLSSMRVYMELHERVYLYLDRDRAGRKHWHMARDWADHYRDASTDYHGYKDLNDWLRGIKAV